MATITLLPSGYVSLTGMSIDSSYPITRAYTDSSSTTFTRFNVTRSTKGYVYFTFDVSSIPTDATINSITVNFKARVSSTTRVTNTGARLYTGTTAKGNSTAFANTTATVRSITPGSWDRTELNNLRLYITGTASSSTSSRRIDFYGADITIDYTEAVSPEYLMVIRATQLAVQIANDPSHGYNQHARYGPDFDCSSLVSYCLQQAGFNIDPHGTYTGNIGDKLSALGFTNVAGLVNLQTGEGLQYGDIVLTVRKHHVEFSLGYEPNNQIVEAVHDEYGGKGSDRTQPGDQTGDEIRIRRFYKWDWQYVYRWTDGGGGIIPTVTGSFVIKFKELRRGNRYAVISPIQTLLREQYNIISVGKSDGIFGEKTEKAVKEFQKQKGLTVDGIVGKNTMKGLLQINDDD